MPACQRELGFNRRPWALIDTQRDTVRSSGVPRSRLDRTSSGAPSTYVTFGGFTASVNNSGRVLGDVSKRRSRHVGYHGWAQDPAVYGPIINSVFVSDTRRRHVSLASGVLGPLRRQSGAMPHVDRDGARNRGLGRLPRRERAERIHQQIRSGQVRTVASGRKLEGKGGPMTRRGIDHAVD